MRTYIKKRADHQRYLHFKAKSGLSAEDLSRETELALPIIRALDEHGIILTDQAMARVAAVLGCSVNDLTIDIGGTERRRS
jgi:predicted transcriptional regulator YheO